jgi:hypothetical protein
MEGCPHGKQSRDPGEAGSQGLGEKLSGWGLLPRGWGEDIPGRWEEEWGPQVRD